MSFPLPLLIVNDELPLMTQEQLNEHYSCITASAIQKWYTAERDNLLTSIPFIPIFDPIIPLLSDPTLFEQFMLSIKSIFFDNNKLLEICALVRINPVIAIDTDGAVTTETTEISFQEMMQTVVPFLHPEYQSTRESNVYTEDEKVLLRLRDLVIRRVADYMQDEAGETPVPVNSSYPTEM